MIRIEGLCISFEDKVVLDRYNAEIGDGITCVTGPSGSGKTTLLKAIAGLIAPDAGYVEGAGKRPALMFQEDRLLPWLTIAENVAAVMETSDMDKVQCLLHEVELDSESAAYPNELSGGMCRRVALARALAYEGDILLLDEPFKGLDMPLIKRIVPIILKQCVPVIISTHSLEEIEVLNGNIIKI